MPTGRWVTVIDGACIGETVTGGLELVDEGSRLLIRVGGPGTAIKIKKIRQKLEYEDTCTSILMTGVLIL